ncbi:hypothetical protein [Actomonas aquatica]|uniref:PEP-CTERM protein-sorting domain-containing protein n=1 Tax=Actomonas aquatica TaxID=2866162 RepID=A0ABZ1C8I7_9BACT|nr:hypothetical protein [Opitutus sp. WL0086]WRQ87737.1 hypothetical protein K1X11_023240 [Opitutus sp. WL0086]
MTFALPPRPLRGLLLLLGLATAVLTASAQIVRYHVHDMAFDDGAAVTGFIDFDLDLEQVDDMELYFWEPTNPPDPVDVVWPGVESVTAPYYYDFEPNEPYLSLHTEANIDFQSGTLLQLGSTANYFNLQLEASMLDAPLVIAAAITDGVLQGSYETASLPFSFWNIGYSGYVHFERSLTSGYLSQTAPLSAVPEPAHYSLALGVGCFGYLAWRRRRQQPTSATEPQRPAPTEPGDG